MNDEHKNEENSPSNESTGPTLNGLVVQEKTNHNRAYDLGDPVNEVVKRTSLNVEQGRIIGIEF